MIVCAVPGVLQRAAGMVDTRWCTWVVEVDGLVVVTELVEDSSSCCYGPTLRGLRGVCVSHWHIELRVPCRSGRAADAGPTGFGVDTDEALSIRDVSLDHGSLQTFNTVRFHDMNDSVAVVWEMRETGGA